MAKYKSDFTITVLSESLYQYNNLTQAPASLGPFGPINLRRKCVPYIAGSLTALEREIRYDCFDDSIDITASLIIPAGQVYNLTLSTILEVDSLLLTPGGQTYVPTYTLDIGSTLPLIAPGGQLYDPTIQTTHVQILSFLTPGGQTYVPTYTLDFGSTLPLITPGAKLYNFTIANTLDICSTLPLITPGAQLYDPTYTLDFGSTLPLITPGAQLYDPTIQTTNVQTLSFLTPGGQTYVPTYTLDICSTLPLITPGGQLYNFTIANTLDICSTLPLITPGAQLYNFTIQATNVQTLSFLTPGAQLYDPTYTLDFGSTLPLITPGAQLYNFTIANTLDICSTLPLIAPGGQLYDPTIQATNVQTLSFLTPGGQTYVPTYTLDFGSTLPLITPGGQLYNFTIANTLDICSTLPLITPGGQLYNFTIANTLDICSTLPLITPGSYLYDPTISSNFNVSMLSQSPGAQLYNPTQFTNTKSIAFNGTNAESQLTVPDSDSLSFGADGTIGNEPSFTWSAWIKPTTLGMSPFSIVSKILTGGTGDEYFFGYVPLVGLTFLIADGDGFGGDYIAQAGVTINTDEWQHVCATYDGSRVPGGMKIYLNGVDASTTGLSPGSYTAMPNSSADLVIGRRWSGLTTNVSDGFIDEVAAFDKELSSAEVSELYNSGNTLNLNTFSAVSDIVSWWRMGDKATGTSPNYTIPDQIGSNDATMTAFQGTGTSGVVADVK